MTHDMTWDVEWSSLNDVRIWMTLHAAMTRHAATRNDMLHDVRRDVKCCMTSDVEWCEMKNDVICCVTWDVARRDTLNDVRCWMLRAIQRCQITQILNDLRCYQTWHAHWLNMLHNVTFGMTRYVAWREIPTKENVARRDMLNDVRFWMTWHIARRDYEWRMTLANFTWRLSFH